MNRRFLAFPAYCAVAATTCYVTLGAGIAFAQTSKVYGAPMDRKTPTVFARGDAGYTTFDSRMVDSNASGTSVRYSAGAWAGDSRTLGMSFTSADTRMKFPLNESKISTSFRDLRAQARFGWVTPTFVASLSEMKGNKEGTEIVDLYGTGFGGGLGVHAPIYERLVLRFEGIFVRTGKAYDKQTRKVSLGDRMEGDAAASFAVLKDILDLNVGYSLRRYTVGVEADTWKESQSTPYVGLQLGTFF